MVQPVSFSPVQAVAAARPVLQAQDPATHAGASAESAGQSAPAPPTPAAVVQIAAAALPNAPHPPGPDVARKPISLSVDKSDGGVFVYTLRDPDSGSVIAVIPRDVLQSSTGRRVDTSA